MAELLSVVIPTHDRPNRLAAAIRSVLDQDYPWIEVVVVDDGSGPETAEVLDGLGTGSLGTDEIRSPGKRLVVIRHDEPRGASASRNIGIGAASGELITFCDDDDIWLPGAATSVVGALTPSMGVVYGYHQVLTEATGRLVTFRPPPGATPNLMRWINVPAILICAARRTRVEAELHFDTDLLTSEDWDMWLRCSELGPMSLVPTALYRYVQHAGNRVTRSSSDTAGPMRFLAKHRASMTPACIAHHEMAFAVATGDWRAAAGATHVWRHPANLGSMVLLAGESVASRVGQRREDPGLALRLAAGAIVHATRPGTTGQRGGDPGTAGDTEAGELSNGRPKSRRPTTRMRRRSKRPPIGAVWIRAQRFFARRETARLATGSALVITPHPDDETIACGLLMAYKVARGVPVTVVLATDGRGGWYTGDPEPPPGEIAKVRRLEWHRSLDALGVPKSSRYELGLPDRGLEEREAELTSRIVPLLADHRPDQVLVSSPDDLHPDHRALGRATCQAVVDVYGLGAATGNGGPELYGYRVYPAAGMWPHGHPGEAGLVATVFQLARSVPRLVRDRASGFRAPEFVPAKVNAIAAYISQENLLQGELRYVWGTDVELFRTLVAARRTEGSGR